MDDGPRFITFGGQNRFGLYRGHMTLTWTKLNSNLQKPSHLVHRGLSYRQPLVQEPRLCSPFFRWVFARFWKKNFSSIIVSIFRVQSNFGRLHSTLEITRKYNTILDNLIIEVTPHHRASLQDCFQYQRKNSVMNYYLLEVGFSLNKDRVSQNLPVLLSIYQLL